MLLEGSLAPVSVNISVKPVPWLRRTSPLGETSRRTRGVPPHDFLQFPGNGTEGKASLKD